MAWENQLSTLKQNTVDTVFPNSGKREFFNPIIQPIITVPKKPIEPIKTDREIAKVANVNSAL